MSKVRVLVLCTGNGARSQIAEGLLRHHYGDRLEVESAGTRPSAVRPEAIAVMREVGIDISRHRAKHVDVFAGQSFDYVITVCDHARETCPIFPASTVQLHRDFPDPTAPDVPEGERLTRFRELRHAMAEYLEDFARSLA